LATQGGGVILGPAGVGKTVLLWLINESLKKFPELKVVNANGVTVERLRNRYRCGNVRNTGFLIDEVGMVALSRLQRIAERQLLGASFILLGDLEGQFTPIQDY
jgi:nucleoside-triphosphatase THEP1